MFLLNRVTVASPKLVRCISSTPALSAKADKILDAKKKAKKLTKLRRQHQQSPENHPLYMDVPKALRYLRAASVGQPSSTATISILMTLVPQRGSKPISGSIFFPNPLKSTKILVLTAKEETQAAALEAGATDVGGPELLEQIKDGKITLDHDQAFATPDMVSHLGKYARLLGSKGLMPMAKKGTVADDVVTLVKNNLGSLPFKQRENHVAVPVARCDFSDKEVLENLKAASEAIYGSQPPGTHKPNLLGQTVLNSTAGPGIVIDFRP